MAVQDYYYSVHGIFLEPEQILLPKAFKDTGKFVREFNNKKYSFEGLHPGDLIYAEKLRNSKGKIIYKSKEEYRDENEWILHFHTAIYLGKLDSSIRSFLPVKPSYPEGTPVIWHSSFISDGTVLWSEEEFLYYYQPVAAKRLI